MGSKLKIVNFIILILFVLSSCATFESQYNKSNSNWKNRIHQEKEEIYSIYSSFAPNKINSLKCKKN